MEMNLQGKVVIVTGGRQGLGHYLVEAFLRKGCQVVTCSRDAIQLAPVIDRWHSHYGDNIFGLEADISAPQGVEQLISTTIKRYGGIDVLINNAASSVSGTTASLTDAQWQAEFDSKLMAIVRSARLVAPIMKHRGGGCIININGIFARQPDLSFYASSVIRAGCLNLTKLLAKEFVDDGIRTNAIGLGLCATEGWLGFHDAALGSYQEFLDKTAEFYKVPMKRMASPQEVANVALFLASNAASYITGTQIDVDGGMSACS